MKYKLISETKKERIYSNGTIQVKTVFLRKGWWAFDDFLQVPFIRSAYAKQIEDNYTYGTNAFDLKDFFAGVKELLKSKDSEKYEKLYAIILEKEESIAAIISPIKQQLAMCAVYVLGPDEEIEKFSEEAATVKINSWTTEESLFFVNWYNDKLQNYYTVFNLIDKIKADAVR